jgi:hypothetical protein
MQWFRLVRSDKLKSLNWITLPRRNRNSSLLSGRVLNKHQSPILTKFFSSTWLTISFLVSVNEASLRTRSTRSLLILLIPFSRNQQMVFFLHQTNVPFRIWNVDEPQWAGFVEVSIEVPCEPWVSSVIGMVTVWAEIRSIKSLKFAWCRELNYTWRS